MRTLKAHLVFTNEVDRADWITRAQSVLGRNGVYASRANPAPEVGDYGVRAKCSLDDNVAVSVFDALARIAPLSTGSWIRVTDEQGAIVALSEA
jgi:hypothetical protein